ncbi:Shedu immune nuclease family protein [Sphingomonas endolithica]|uniref:Shedu immune nuclease family protein n=1 Tax=Sphingomonas endolithica TaxID=2972485 RepID=UPI0021AE5CA1|nr:Shedu immune nuclease family protein [Sphingomonas sp. ZFBP2030]
MAEYKVSRSGVVLEYRATLQGNAWIMDELKTGEVEISSVFTFTPDDLLEKPTQEEIKDDFPFTYRFRLAVAGPSHYFIAGRKLGIDQDVLIAKSGVEWRRKLFVAERNISIFKRIAKLILEAKEIVIGGKREDAIPIEAFEDLIARFPNTYEMDRYAETRVTNIIGEYIEPERDFREQYETYLSRRKSRRSDTPLHAKELLTTEIEKFQFVRDTLKAWLKAGDKSEDQWQKALLSILPLIFPKYVAVIEKVPIEDRYTTPGKIHHREIDIALVDVNGNIDVIEIKKPEADILLRKTLYRGNYVPTGTLSGTIMQAEKYLFHLSKGGLASEEKITQKFRKLLPPNLRIRITNPKAMCILGRDRKDNGHPAFDEGQSADLEVIKRKYANMIDIITYDDLLHRLDNILASLKRRRANGLDATTL